MQQMTIYDFLNEKKIITKPIRLIELFAGYGSQALALKYLGVDFTHWRICEWATKSIQAYNDLHIRDYNDYSKDLTTDAVINRLATYGVSMNYNEPMTYDQIKRKGEKWQRQTYNNIIATNNLVDISKTKAKDLNITDADKYEYILTYSFPCQDLSIAGKRKGMAKDNETRSGMLWHVERLLNECETLPQVLIMENVPQIISKKNIEDFKLWQQQLESLGYSNYSTVLNATKYAIPQKRERCFMISILGNFKYNFPKKINLKYALKNMLEKKVTNNFYLSNKMLECFLKENTGGFNRKERFLQSLEITNIKGIAITITTSQGNRPISNYIIDKPICLNSKVNGKQPSLNDRVYSISGVMPTCTTTTFFMGNILQNGKVRKLTPKECFRLMGVKDQDFNNIVVNQSNSSLYHLAGDSIVTTCLMAIFGELLGLDYETKINELVEELKECV